MSVFFSDKHISAIHLELYLKGGNQTQYFILSSVQLKMKVINLE